MVTESGEAGEKKLNKSGNGRGMSPTTHANLSLITDEAKQKRHFRVLAKRQEKSDALFGMYWQEGTERSLDFLQAQCGKLGIKVSHGTLSTYSRKYHWQERLLKMAAKERELIEQDAVRQVVEMNVHHAKTFRALFTLGEAGMQRHLQELRQKQAEGKPITLSMDWPDLLATLSTAQRGERLARGQATSRLEVLVDVVNEFVQEFALIFTSVPGITDEQRQHFAQESDAMLKRYLGKEIPKLKAAEE